MSPFADLICHLFINYYEIRTFLCMKNGEICVISKPQLSLICNDEVVLVQTEINSDLLHFAVQGIDWMITPHTLVS